MKKIFKVGVLGHWGGNIGHEIMALGIEFVLKKVFGFDLESVRIEQHRPFDIYPYWHPLHYAIFLNHNKGGFISKPLKRFINKQEVSKYLWPSSWVGILDLGVACGGPLLTPSLSSGDLELMFHHIFGAFATKGVPVLNLSVGSCYPWEHIPKTIEGINNINFLRRVFQYASLTTFRETLAHQLCESIGLEGDFIPDSGYIAGNVFSRLARGNGSKYIIINYQKYGANNDWGQGVDPKRWKDVLRKVIGRLQQRYRVVFMCHNRHELALAKAFDSTISRFLPTTMQEYAELIAGAIGGICSRIHAAVALAGIGVPVVGVGTDSRLRTLSDVGIPCMYVKDVSAELLEETLEDLISRRGKEQERLLTVRQDALKRYVAIVENMLQRC